MDKVKNEILSGEEDRHKRLKSLIKETSAITAAVTIAKKYHQKQSMYMVDVHALGVEMHVQVV